MTRVLRKEFFITLFIKQNQWHKHSVLVHTLKLAYLAYKAKRYDYIVPALLHDIAKPLTAIQDEQDVIRGTYSFPNHEELGYQIIKDCRFISERTKNLVRYHYLLRGLQKAQQKKQTAKFKRLARQFDKLDTKFIHDLRRFQALDDKAKR